MKQSEKGPSEPQKQMTASQKINAFIEFIKNSMCDTALAQIYLCESEIINGVRIGMYVTYQHTLKVHYDEVDSRQFDKSFRALLQLIEQVQKQICVANPYQVIFFPKRNGFLSRYFAAHIELTPYIVRFDLEALTLITESISHLENVISPSFLCSFCRETYIAQYMEKLHKFIEHPEAINPMNIKQYQEVMENNNQQPFYMQKQTCMRLQAFVMSRMFDNVIYTHEFFAAFQNKQKLSYFNPIRLSFYLLNFFDFVEAGTDKLIQQNIIKNCCLKVSAKTLSKLNVTSDDRTQIYYEILDHYLEIFDLNIILDKFLLIKDRINCIMYLIRDGALGEILNKCFANDELAEFSSEYALNFRLSSVLQLASLILGTINYVISQYDLFQICQAQASAEPQIESCVIDDTTLPVGLPLASLDDDIIAKLDTSQFVHEAVCEHLKVKDYQEEILQSNLEKNKISFYRQFERDPNLAAEAYQGDQIGEANIEYIDLREREQRLQVTQLIYEQ